MKTRREKNEPAPKQRQDRVKIGQVPTGVPGLNEILGGGLPEYSFNIVAGAPGGGKTTLAHQIMFANRGLTSGIPEPWSVEFGQNVPNLRDHLPKPTTKSARPRRRS